MWRIFLKAFVRTSIPTSLGWSMPGYKTGIETLHFIVFLRGFDLNLLVAQVIAETQIFVLEFSSANRKMLIKSSKCQPSK